MTDVITKLAQSCEPQGDCWQWSRGLFRTGYGRITINSRPELAHRVAYEALVEPIPQGLDIDHLCRNRACINPDHLEPVTRRENLRRSPITAAAINAAKTHCSRGHEFTAESTYYHGPRGEWRTCRICVRELHRGYRRSAARRGESR